MVRSRDLLAGERARVQKQFAYLVDSLNARYSAHLLSKFVITLGDEFQGLLHRAEVLPGIIWDIEKEFSERDIRIGFGCGVLFTPPHEFAINVDGPALHNAREAIEQAKTKSLMGGVFDGFGNSDEILNGLARILWFHRSRWTSQQRTTVELLRRGVSKTEISDSMKISKQAVSKHANASGATSYLAGERAFQVFLEQHVDSLLRGKVGDSAP
jgi:predicted DNA-binding protein YlxM (UPF0122 family)